MSPINPLTCAQAFSRLDDYLDRELSLEEIEEMRQHLEACAHCAAEVRFEESVLRNVRSKLQRIAVPVGFEGRVWRTLMEAQRAEAQRSEAAPMNHPRTGSLRADSNDRERD